MHELSAERVLQTYSDPAGNPFRISEVDATVPPTSEPAIACARGISEVLLASWRAKFVPEVLDKEDLDVKILDAEAQAAKIAKGQARYLIACAGREPQLEPEILAFSRIRTYRPRRLRRPEYPDITDVESRDGRLMVAYHRHAAALLLHGLEVYNSDRLVSAYTEEPNPDGQDFFVKYGFEPDYNMSRRALTEVIGHHKLTYAHMVAPSVGRVRERLLQYNSFLRESAKSILDF